MDTKLTLKLARVAGISLLVALLSLTIPPLVLLKAIHRQCAVGSRAQGVEIPSWAMKWKPITYLWLAWAF